MNFALSLLLYLAVIMIEKSFAGFKIAFDFRATLLLYAKDWSYSRAG